MAGKLLKGKAVVVTGAGGLLGREFCAALAAEGARVAAADISPAAAKVADGLNREFGAGTARYVKLDITSKKSVLAAIAAAKAAFGRVDAVVNSAYPRNKNFGRRFEQVEYKDFCENLSLHLGGYFLVSQQFAEFFKKQGGGNVVNISSVYGVIPPRFQVYEGTPMTLAVEYAPIKAGVVILTKYMARYYKGCGIRFNAVSPGGILDGQPEPFLQAYREFCVNKGMLDRTDISGTVVYLLSDLSRQVNGQNLIVDDGFTL